MKTKATNGVDRRTFLAASVVAESMIAMCEMLVANTTGKKTFTIIHTNDLSII